MPAVYRMQGEQILVCMERLPANEALSYLLETQEQGKLHEHYSLLDPTNWLQAKVFGNFALPLLLSKPQVMCLCPSTISCAFNKEVNVSFCP